MRGYAKITSFSQRSKSKKEYPFLDQDFDSVVDVYSSATRANEQIIIKDDKNKKNEFLRGSNISKKYDCDHKLEPVTNEREKFFRVLGRNLSLSQPTSLQNKKYGKGDSLERQSSKKAMQDAVKRTFSMNMSSSINSDRYSRIHDQPSNVKDIDYNHDYCNNEKFNHHQDNHGDYDTESCGSMERGYIGLKKKNKDVLGNGKKNASSKVVKICKRLFSR